VRFAEKLAPQPGSGMPPKDERRLPARQVAIGTSETRNVEQ
jgi:hypothetical protein